MNCDCNSKDYADFQHAGYDKQTNQILYGINKNMKVLGVSDGTCNQINPVMYTNEYKCGLGAAGGNPCNNKTNNNNRLPDVSEFFESENNNNNCNYNGCKITNYVQSIIILLLIYLIFLAPK